MIWDASRSPLHTVTTSETHSLGFLVKSPRPTFRGVLRVSIARILQVSEPLHVHALTPCLSLCLFVWSSALAGCDNVVILWNVACGEAMVRIDDIHPDTIYSACWNRDGSRIATSCKDKKLRVLDPRKGTVIAVSLSPLSAFNLRSHAKSSDLVH